MTELREVPLSNSSQVAIHLGALSPAGKRAQTGKPGCHNLFGIRLQRRFRPAMDRRLISGKEPAKTDRWRVRAAFRKRERTHANRDDPTCSRVRGCIAWY